MLSAVQGRCGCRYCRSVWRLSCAGAALYNLVISPSYTLSPRLDWWTVWSCWLWCIVFEMIWLNDAAQAEVSSNTWIVPSSRAADRP